MSYLADVAVEGTGACACTRMIPSTMATIRTSPALGDRKKIHVDDDPVLDAVRVLDRRRRAVFEPEVFGDAFLSDDGKFIPKTANRKAGPLTRWNTWRGCREAVRLTRRRLRDHITG